MSIYDDHLCSFLLQTAALKLVNVGMATVNKLVYQPVVAKNHRTHSLEKRKTIGISDVVDVLDQAWDYHTSIISQPTTFRILQKKPNVV